MCTVYLFPDEHASIFGSLVILRVKFTKISESKDYNKIFGDQYKNLIFEANFLEYLTSKADFSAFLRYFSSQFGEKTSINAELGWF